MPTFMALPPNPDFERVQRALEWAHNNKGNWPNAEARLFRPLRAGMALGNDLACDLLIPELNDLASELVVEHV